MGTFVYGSKNESPLGEVPTLSSGQQSIADQLEALLGSGYSNQNQNQQNAQQLMDLINQYSTQGNVDLSSGAAIGADYNTLMGTQDFALDEQRQAALEAALSGNINEDYWKDTIAGPMTREFNERVVPQISEAFVGPGTGWGTARGDAVSGAGEDLTNALASARGQLGQNALERQLSAADIMTTYKGNQERALLETLAAERRAKLQTARDENAIKIQALAEQFLKNNPGKYEQVQQMLQYLGIPTVGFYNKSPEDLAKISGASTWS